MSPPPALAIDAPAAAAPVAERARLLADGMAWVDEVAPDLAGCAQNPRWHPEGDVRTHTLLVTEALLADPAWAALPPGPRHELYLAALLHDVGKPATSVTEDGAIRSPGHARVGAVIARGILWRAGTDPAARERICALVRHHMIPRHLLSHDDARRRTLWLTLGCRLDHLLILARADTLGRGCHPSRHEAALEDLELVGEWGRELGCLDRAYPFASDHARFWYFRRPERDPAWDAYDDSRSEVVVLSGLPGAGKDAWAARHLPGHPVVSLDRIRAQAGISPGTHTGRVVFAAREAAREHLRAGRPFVWSATNLSRMIRGQLIDLLADYGARVRIVSVEASPDQIARRNAARPGHEAVPATARERMLRRWEAPEWDECHRLERVTG